MFGVSVKMWVFQVIVFGVSVKTWCWRSVWGECIRICGGGCQGFGCIGVCGDSVTIFSVVLRVDL